MKLAFVLYAVLLSSCYTEALPFKALRLNEFRLWGLPRVEELSPRNE